MTFDEFWEKNGHSYETVKDLVRFAWATRGESEMPPDMPGRFHRAWSSDFNACPKETLAWIFFQKGAESVQAARPEVEPTEPDELHVVLDRYENAVKAEADRGDEDDEFELNAARDELMSVLRRALSAVSPLAATKEKS